MNKDYKVTFYMKNRDEFEIIFRNTTKQDIIDAINKLGKGTSYHFIGNETGKDYINLNEVNYFHTEELSWNMKEENK